MNLIPRRFLPPTPLLYAFESAARTQNFTLAARELSLTQSAVSRQIRALEELLGAPLFHREKQKVYLTRSEEHTSELQSLMRISYAVFCLKKKTKQYTNRHLHTNQHTIVYHIPTQDRP